MRKFLLCVMFLCMMCFVSGCGSSGTEERLKTGEERALELKQDAKEVVDEMNEDTIKMNETADVLEDAIEE